MVALSILDLSPIPEGADAAQAFGNTVELARHVERLGFRRYWLAEHHNMAGIGSAATAVLIGHVAGATATIRVGAGGIMLPNHAPLVIAEQFGTLESLYPGRIDLGIGRAPGTDQMTSHALRRTLTGDVNDFPRDVVELQSYFQPTPPGRRVRAVPGAGLNVPIWILGSSLFGAQLAAALGLPYAFASHFAPAALMQAIEVYREQFRPSEQCAAPYVMAGFNVFAADSEEEAAYVRSSAQQSVLNLHQNAPGPLPRPVRGFEAYPGCAGALHSRTLVHLFGLGHAGDGGRAARGVCRADRRGRDHGDIEHPRPRRAVAFIRDHGRGRRRVGWRLGSAGGGASGVSARCDRATRPDGRLRGRTMRISA